MPSTPYIIADEHGNEFHVQIRPDRRLKKSARWTRREGNTIILRIPYRMPRENIEKLLDDVVKQVSRIDAQVARRTDEDLQERATYINRHHFNSEITWNTIRWVGNMNNRLGSCTNGGSTDGQIRISDRIRDWPQWVIDYVVAHELAHRKHSNHGPEFWAYLRAAFPLTERALGFIEGVGFARNESINGGAENID